MTIRHSYLICLVICLLAATSAFADVQRVKFSTDEQYLIIEVLDDDLVHFEISAIGNGPNIDTPIYTSPMVLKTDYTGPSSYHHNGSVIETADIKIQVEMPSLCVVLEDKTKQQSLSRICPLELDKDWKGLTLTKGKVTQVYGLGQQFKLLGSADGDWLEHRVREEQPAGQSQTHGNGFMPFGPAGMVGNIQMPIMYAVGDNNLNYSLFIDNVYKRRWDFTKEPWQVRMWGDQLRFYIMTGPNLPDLRKDYMELVGRPLVPPRKAFGLWVSEFGYKNWWQIEALRKGLRRDAFPVDGFVLDLQWFGGIIRDDPDSPMGRLDWDQDKNDGNDDYFPDPDSAIAYFAKDHLGLVTIEESYISKHTTTLKQMEASGDFLAYARTNGRCDPNHEEPVFLKDWFGEAAMVDWSDIAAGSWVHNHRRFPNLVQKGILGHWTDLGEPEKYDANACYKGVEVTATGPKNQHGDVHNLYAFLWNQSIYEGYKDKSATVDRRPFILSRSGAPGSQRFGVAMWSGDIGSDLRLLATHLNAQLHMSFSGIDYYGSDIGGFRREGMPYNENHSGRLQYQKELYTQWLANGAWFDVPMRPHTGNAFQTDLRYETAPNLVGDFDSNRQNLRQRYELIPYYYSLAYRAYLYGEPLIPPLVFYYQDDPNVRGMGHEKLIGRDLLVAVVAKHGEFARNVYLPEGKWINYHTREWFHSSGESIRSFPTYIKGVFKLPVFARAGSILPMMYVDAQTQDVFGHRQDSADRNELVVRVYADAARSEFTLYEDDGKTLHFDSVQSPVYETMTTVISQQLTNDTVTVTIGKVKGAYNQAPNKRNNVLRLVVEDAQASSVKLNDRRLPKHDSAIEFDTNEKGWYNAGRNLVLIKSGTRAVSSEKTLTVKLQPVASTSSVNFVCDKAWTTLGENVYVTGNIAALGNWDPDKAIKLDPSVYYEYIYNPPPNHDGPGPNTPKWTGLISNLPTGGKLEWKCIKKVASGDIQWQSDPNNTIQLPSSGFAGTSIGFF